MNGEQITTTGDIFQGRRRNAGGWQDKAPQVRLSAASAESYTPSESAVDSFKQHGSEKRQTAHTSSRLPHHIKTRLLEIAGKKGWSESRVVAEACAVYVENDLAEQFGVKLAARVTEAIDRGLAKHSNREAYLSKHAYFAAEESRVITMKVLR